MIFDYPASLPISKGDYIGDAHRRGAVDDVPQHTTSGLPKNLIANNFTGQPADGDGGALLADEQHDLLLQATVKFCKVPDLKGLKLADAQSKLAAADCASTVTKKKLKKSKKNRKKKGKVLVPVGSGRYHLGAGHRRRDHGGQAEEEVDGVKARGGGER